MTNWEKAAIMAYTGVVTLAGDKLGIYYRYVQEKLGRPVFTHEFASEDVARKIKEAAEPDFLAICADAVPEAVLRSLGPLQQPLTLEELQAMDVPCPIWYERGGVDSPEILLEARGPLLFTHRGLRNYRPSADDTAPGRFWRNRPTAAERAAANRGDAE